MEAHQNDHHQQAAAAGEGQLGGGKNNNNSTGSSGGFMCRQSSSRWTPTSEQIRILKDLYYNNGVRSPTAEQIQRISAKLRQYGKIEGKNVFYWFQNHKARERQKKRFTTTNADHHHHHIAIPSRNHHDHHLLLHHHHHHLSSIYNNNNNNNNNKHLSNHPAPGNHLPSSSSSPGLLTVGNYGYGSLAMEKSFRDYCSISPSGGNGGGGHNFAWVGVDSSSSSSSSSSYPYPFIDKRKYTTSTNDHHQTLEILEGDDEEEEEEALPEIETLPLFPIHGQVKHQEINYFNGWRADDVAASLELTLNSYAPTSSSFPTS